jgi:hypothetical protein
VFVDQEHRELARDFEGPQAALEAVPLAERVGVCNAGPELELPGSVADGVGAEDVEDVVDV